MGRAFVHLCLSMSLGLAAMLSTGPASAANEAARSEAEEAREMLSWLRKLRYTGEVPVLTGFSAAQPVSGFTAPPGGHDHSQAYRSAAGCVAFFAPPSDDMSDVAFKVKGLKCNGKPLAGKGELQIQRRLKKGTGFVTIVGLLRGDFSGGMLTGEGEKGNFTFTSAGKPVEDTYLFFGNFENSVLNGKGERRWTGAKTDQPSAYSMEGTFKDGVLRGVVFMGRLNPLPGVEGDYVPLYFSERGNSYIEQAHLNGGKMTQGFMFLYNDPARWKVEIATWDAQVQGGAFTRVHPDADGFYAVCDKWVFGEGKISCEDGNVGGGLNGTYVGITRSPFTIPLPFRTKQAPFNVKSGQRVTVGLEMDKRPGILCNEDLSRCSGKLLTSVLAAPFYWHVDADVRDGTVYPTSGRLYERASGEAYSTEYKYETDRVMASCSVFKTPVVCAKGVVYFRNGTKGSGEWRFDGVDFEQVSDRGHLGYVAKRAFKLVLNGDVRLDYSNGSWADIVMDDGDIESVDDCGVSDGSSVRCSVDGNMVSFQRQGDRSNRPSAEYVTPVEPLRMPRVVVPEYKPMVIPARPVYILPGMR